MGPRPWPIEDMPTDDIGIECLALKEKFWYPEVLSNESHWVPIAEDPLSCIGDQSLFEVKRLAIIFVIQATVETTHQIEVFIKSSTKGCHTKKRQPLVDDFIFVLTQVFNGKKVGHGLSDGIGYYWCLCGR